MELTISELAGIAFSQGVPSGLVVFGCWFLVKKIWPWWDDERKFQRERSVTREENDHASDIAHTQAQNNMAAAISLLAESVRDCPLKQ